MGLVLFKQKYFFDSEAIIGGYLEAPVSFGKEYILKIYTNGAHIISIPYLMEEEAEADLQQIKVILATGT